MYYKLEKKGVVLNVFNCPLLECAAFRSNSVYVLNVLVKGMGSGVRSWVQILTLPHISDYVKIDKSLDLNKSVFPSEKKITSLYICCENWCT